MFQQTPYRKIRKTVKRFEIVLLVVTVLIIQAEFWFIFSGAIWSVVNWMETLTAPYIDAPY